MRRLASLGSLLFVASIAHVASAGGTLAFGAVTPNQKVRPMDQPTLAPSYAMKAAKNEFEPFQVVLEATGGDVAQVSLALEGDLTSKAGTIKASNVVLYREAYYDVGTASNLEGASGLWPDPLIPDKDVYFGETRNAFPFDVTSGESRAVLVDVFVPADAKAGDYAGAVDVLVAGQKQGSVAFTLHVGTFSLPSTASLKSEFGMGWADPCIAHTGDNYCNDPNGSDVTADKLRALYVRSALEHRFTIGLLDFQPPIYSGDAPPFEQYLLPYANGTGASRLQGAKVTSVVIDGGDAQLAQWIAYAQAKGFFDRLLYYPTDEPGSDQSAWDGFISHAEALHSADATARILITSTIDNAQAAGADGDVDVFVPVIDELEGRPDSSYPGNQRSKYDAWLMGASNREVWSYQSCDEHGCGNCGDPSTSPDFSGWPNRVIDSTAVQDRAFPWHAFRLSFTGELYFDTTYQLSTAWNDNGQCAFSGSGDGTLFYPGTVAEIGGQDDIPIESYRMKMIREGMEDYEYLTLVAAKDPSLAMQIANGLFPATFMSDQPPGSLEAARDQLFAALDMPSSSSSASAGGSTTTSASTGSKGAGGASNATSASATSGAGGEGTKDNPSGDSNTSGGCGCATPSGAPTAPAIAMALLGLAALVRRRRS